MTREWEVTCKRCGKKFGYSDRAYRNSLKYGFSRPEYCDECQKKEKVMRRGMGSPYFHVPLVISEIEPGPLGYIDREERVHVATKGEGHFDETRFGLTQDRVREIADWFRNPNHRVVIVVGPTGSGKSTALPYWLVYPPSGVEEDFFTKDGQILVTQPRILAMKKIANYLGSDLMGSSIGAGYDIGYTYSKEDKSDWRNAIDLATDGKLVNWIVAGRISQYGLILLDEAHERSENIETIMRLLKDRMGLYPNLKLIITSATIDVEFFRRYFDQEGAKKIEFEGKARVDAHGNPVKYDVFFASEEERLPYEEVGSLSRAILNAVREKAKWLVEEIVARRKDWGDILIFLHSKRPINKLVEDLRVWANQDEVLAEVVEVYPLYRDEDEDLTDVAYEDPRPGKLRMIVSTNIAEASVTIDSIVYELETGVEIQPKFNAETGASKYPMVLISKANARQRWGRTGRTRNGEVYCLYTEEQFNELFPKFPVAAIQRSSMEGVVLTAKTAGIPKILDGWLENPPETEIERSTDVLIKSGALTEDKSLTSYGLMIRQFSYTPRLFDLLMAADDTGCSVEMATILPVIKNGGTRRLLSWKFSWDIYTKCTAYRRHQALMAGARDDVEFILKLYKAWDELPWLDENQLRNLNEEELNSLRKQWADLHFVNHKTMLAIAEERNQTLERLSIGTKEEGVQSIDLSQIGRVRTLLWTMLKDVGVTGASDPYRYTAEIEPQTGSLVTCSLIAPNGQSEEKPESWLDTPSLEEVVDGISSRLFVDQVYPIGHRFEAKVEGQEGEYVWIKTTRNLTRAQTLTRQTENLAEEDEELGDALEDEMEQEKEQEKAKGISLADISIWYKSVDCKQAVLTSCLVAGEEVVVEITGFDFRPGQPPIVIAKVVPQPEPFDVFAKRHRYSDEVTVEVLDTLKFEGDYVAALVVHDIETDLEVLIEPQDMGFTRSAYAVTQIYRGTRLTLNIEHIDLELRRVRLTNWEKAEGLITNRFVSSEGDEETTVAKATVIEIRDDGKVVFVLDLGQISTDVCIITSAYGSKLPKDSGEFSLGEQVVLKVYRRSRGAAHVDLPSLPAKAVSKTSTEERPNELSWKRGVLRFTGRMTYDRLYEIKTIADKNLDFQRALEKLYWYSNQVYVAQLIDSELYAHMQSKLAVGTIIDNAIVMEINKGGVVVELGHGITGFVPKSKVMGGIGNLSTLLAPGASVQVKVLEHRMDKGEPLLEITGGVADPIMQIVVGQTYQGVIEAVNQNGIFVTLAAMVTGRVKHNEVYRGRYRTEELFKSGDSVIVKILSVNQAERKVELSMKIPENDPLSQLEVGQSCRGVIVNVTQHGAFIELAPALDGLLQTQDFPKRSGFLGLGGPPKIEAGMTLVVKVTSVDYARRKVSLTYQSRAK